MLIQKGGHVGALFTSHISTSKRTERLTTSVDVRHASQYQCIFMLVGDRKESISSISINAESLSFDTPLQHSGATTLLMLSISVHLRNSVRAGNFCSIADRRAVKRSPSECLRMSRKCY